MTTKEIDTLVWNVLVVNMHKKYAIRIDTDTLDIHSPMKIKPYMTELQTSFITDCHAEIMKIIPIIVEATKDICYARKEGFKKAAEKKAAYFAEKKKETERVVRIAQRVAEEAKGIKKGGRRK